MLLRTATSVIGLPLVVAGAWFGGGWLLALLMASVLLGLWEFSRLAEGMGAQPTLTLMLATAMLLLLNAFWAWGRGELIIGAGALAILSWQAVRAWTTPASSQHTDAQGTPANAPLLRSALGWAFSVLGVLYLGWTLSHAILIRDLPHGRESLILVAAAIFATDTAAYLIGRAAGRRPMAPSISPNKTWEGAVGGLVGGIAAGLGLSAAFAIPAAWWQAAALGGSIALAAEVGDLAESLLKRASGAGASGGLLPGHGGVLDRLDSVVFGLVVGYYFVTWVVS